MADAPPTTNRPAQTMSGNSFTRKLGPLPVWGWAALLLVGYFAYQHFHGQGATGTNADTTGNGTYVPPFDAASGGVNGAYTPGGTSYTYNYYGDTAAAQAAGGGTGQGQRTTDNLIGGGSPNPGTGNNIGGTRTGGGWVPR